MPPKTILQKIKAGTSAASSRMKLVTREDLRNIRDKYNIDKAERRHPDDFTSVELWVKEMEEKDLNTGNELMSPENEPSKAGSDSPLLYYRKEGDPSSSEGNFELALMTFPQRELLCKLGIEKLCIDSTHGTNRYKFQLTTLLTISEDGCGIPCAYLISKRVNTETMVRFFEAIKGKVGVIECKAFMSDDAPVYGNTWEQMMGPLKNRWLCIWHVMRSWNAHLNMISSIKYRNVTRETLHALINADETEIDKKVKEFLNLPSKLHTQNNLASKDLEDLESFTKYFEKTYAKRVLQWAYCYRKQVGLTTNNHIESMHKTLKYSYFGGQVNVRLDKLIYVLFTLTADKLFNRAVALIKGKVDHRKSAIFKKHKAGIDIQTSDIDRVGDGVWQVKSQSIVNFHHIVKKTGRTCTGCELHCKHCEACHNIYTCTCLDHVTYVHMCKHIHAVALMVLQSSKLPSHETSCSSVSFDNGSQSFCVIDDPSCLMASAQGIMQSTKQCLKEEKTEKRIEKFKVQAEAAFQQILKNLPETSCEKMDSIEHDLTKLVKKHKLADVREPAGKLRLVPANKNLQKQRRYAAPKKSKSKMALGHRPTMLEQEAIKRDLLGGEMNSKTLFIHTGNDHHYCRPAK